MKFTKNLMRCVQISWFYLFFILFYLCLWPKVKFETTNHLFRLREKNNNSTSSTFTNVIPSQQNRWRWIFGRSFYTFQSKIDLILRQIQRWIWEKQLIKPKVQRLPHGNHSMKPTSTPSTFNNCNSLTAKSMALNFWEELLHLLN
jgi:hypothetical protein